MAGKVGRKIYFTKRWKLLKERVRARAGYLCEQCKKKGFTVGGEEVHHIKPLAGFPALAFRESNLILLCRECHYKEKKSDALRSQKDIEFDAFVKALT